MNFQNILQRTVVLMGVIIVVLLGITFMLKPDFQAINEKANATLPKMIDKVTRMDSIELKAHQTISHYTSIGFITRDYKQKITLRIMNNTCRKMQKEIKGGHSYHFIYHHIDGSEYANILVDKAKCKV